MRILIVSHYFPPEVGAPQTRLSELASLWTAAGDEVTVLTGMPNHPTGVIAPEYRGKLRTEEQVDGYRVVRTCLYATPNKGVGRKTLGHLSFMLTSVLLGGSRTERPDVVVVSSPTFFSILSAWLLARIRRARFVVEVRDLWPLIFVELGVLTSRPLIRALEALELAVYRAADAVVVVTEGFRRNLIERGVPAGKVHTIRNGADVERFSAANGNRVRERKRLGVNGDETLVLYLGAHGISHGLDSVVQAAAKLSDQPIQLAFVGEGAQKDRLAQAVEQLSLRNVRLHPSVPKEQVPAVVAAADICLVPLRDVPLFDTFIPSKMFEYLAAGQAVIGAVRGEAAEILTEAGALVVPPECPEQLADAIAALAADPDRRAAMGAQGRAFVADHFERRRLAERYRKLLQSVISAR